LSRGFFVGRLKMVELFMFGVVLVIFMAFFASSEFLIRRIIK